MFMVRFRTSSYSAITTIRKATEDIPPAEAEANYYRQLNSQAAMAA